MINGGILLRRKQFLAALSAFGLSAPLRPLRAAAQGATPAAPEAPAPKPAAPPVTADLADFVMRTRWEDLSPELIELGRKSILDGLGLALAGTRAESGPIVMRYLGTLGFGHDGATVLGTGLRAPPRFAAFANAVSIHADDFDDTQLAAAPDRVYGLLCHPTVTTLPPALAMAETGGRSGRDMMLAYHLGVEAETKIAEAIAPRSYENGFHTTGMCGVFGAAVATARLRGLDRTQLLRALGVAGAQSSGLRENFGTMTKPFQAGHAAEGGVMAADLADLGWTAAENILEAKRGFFEAYGGGFDPNAIVGKLGQPWTFVSPGVSIKPFPSGSLTHPGMTLMQELIRKNDIRPDQVEAVRVGASGHMLNTLIHHDPKTGLEAKFSMEYCMAILLARGKAGLAEFQDSVVNQPDVQAMVRKVDFYDSKEADAAGFDKMHTVIDIRLRDGRTVSGRADYGKGSPQIPASFDDVVEKFRGCAEYAHVPDDDAKRIVEAVRGLEKLDDVRKLTALCVTQA